MEADFKLWSCDRAVLCFARREITRDCLNKEQLCPPHYHHLGKILSQPLAGAVFSAVQSETCTLSTTTNDKRMANANALEFESRPNRGSAVSTQDDAVVSPISVSVSASSVESSPPIEIIS